MPIATMTIPEVYAHRGATPTEGANMTEKSVIEWLRYQAGELRVWQAKGALDVLERQLPAQPKPPAWVVTWTVIDEFLIGGPIGGTYLSDGVSTLTSWPAVVDYIERIVPRGATFTVKPA